MGLVADKTDLKEEFLKLFKEHQSSLNEGFPDFFRKETDKAIAAFAELGIPSKKSEKYKYADLNGLFSGDIQKLVQPRNISFQLDDIFSCDIPELDADPHIVLNGWYYDRENPLRKLDNGVIIGSFAAAVKQYPELVETHFSLHGGYPGDGLHALGAAFSRDGFFMYIPRGVVMEKPVQLINIMMSDSDLVSYHRSLVIAEENSQAKLVICDHTLSAHKFISNSILEVHGGENSVVDLVKMQNEHNMASQLSHIYIHQEQGSNVSSNTVSLHGGFIRNNLYVHINGEGCESNAYGLYLTDRGQYIDNFVFMDHAHPHCNSNQLFKGVLDDQARGAFNGQIMVRRDAQKTNAYQSNNNILLTDDAKMYSRPQLEIYADDVKCSHGSTVGQLDESAMFYLRSRGIPKREARLMLMYAFAHDIVSKIGIEPLRERVDHLVHMRLRGELSRCNSCPMHCC
jgi:Fe-S cluster assembly protein SufD